MVHSTFRVLGVIGVALILLSACSGSLDPTTADESPTPTPLPTPVILEKPTYTVELGTVVQTLDFTGRVSPEQEQELYFTSGGYVDQVFVKRGDTVQAGDLLAQLDISSLERQLEQSQLSLQAVELNIQNAQVTLESDVADAQLALSDAQTALAQGRSVDAQITILEAQNALDSANASREDAQETYDTAWDPARDWELGDPRRADSLVNERESATANLENAYYNLTLAELQYRQTMNTLQDSLETLQRAVTTAEQNLADLESGTDPQLELDLETAKLNVEEIQLEIEASQLFAPFDGQITTLNLSAGDNVSAYTAVMVLADPNNLEVTAELGTDLLSEMSIGQEALITLRNKPDQELTGSVRQLPYPYGGGTSDVSDTDTAAHITVDSDVELEMGELATVVIVLQEKDNVLWLPPAAIRTFSGRNFVVIQIEDGQRRADVEVGIVTDDRVEIEQGVEEGQIIVGE